MIPSITQRTLLVPSARTDQRPEKRATQKTTVMVIKANCDLKSKKNEGGIKEGAMQEKMRWGIKNEMRKSEGSACAEKDTFPNSKNINDT